MSKTDEEVREHHRKIDFVCDEIAPHLRAINKALKEAADKNIPLHISAFDLTPKQVERLGGKPRKYLDISVYPRTDSVPPEESKIT